MTFTFRTYFIYITLLCILLSVFENIWIQRDVAPGIVFRLRYRWPREIVAVVNSGGHTIIVGCDYESRSGWTIQDGEIFYWGLE